jgi:hypothetical protein
MRLQFIGLLSAFAAISSAATLNFDDLGTGAQSGSYHGIEISYYNASVGGNGYSFSAGDTLDTASATSGFYTYTDSGTAWSGSNVAYNPGTGDLLVDFKSAVTGFSVLSDRYPNDGNDALFVLGLTRDGNGNFHVAEAKSGSDGAVNGADNLYSLTGTYQYVALVSTTEQEGWDDLTYQPVPEPTTMAVLGFGIVGLMRRRAKKA